MTLGTLLWRNMGRRKIRLILSLLAITVAFLLFGITAAIRQNFSAAGPTGAAQRLVVSSAIGATAPLPYSSVAAIQRIKGVDKVAYRSMVAASYQEKRNLFLLMDVDPAPYLSVYSDLVVTPGARNAFVADKGSILVGRTLANRFGWKVGNRVPINERLTNQSSQTNTKNYLIVGFFDSSEAAVGTGYALGHWAAFNEGREVDKDMVSNIVVETADSKTNDAVSAAIDQSFINSPYETYTATEEAFSRAQIAQIGDIQAITIWVMLASFFAILLIVGSSFTASVRERRREIGILRSFGFMPQRLFEMLVMESLLLTAIGGLVGLLLANLGVKILKGVNAGTFGRLAITSTAWAEAIFLIVAFGILVAIVPAWRATKLEITAALQRR